MKITHAISSIETGEETLRICSILKGLSDSFNISLIAPENADAIKMLSGTRVKLMPLKIKEGKSFSPTDVYKIRAAIRRDPPDILHSHAQLSARIAAKLCKVPFLISERTGRGRKTHARSLVSEIYNSLTEITVSASDSVTRQLISEGVPKDRIAYIECGVSEADTGAFLSGKSTDFSVAFRVMRVEEIRLFVSALARILSRFRVKALLLCSSKLRCEAERLVFAFGLAKHVDILSSLAHQDVNFFAYLNAEDDSLPLEAMRFMSSSIPVAVALTPRNRDFFVENESAVFFLPADPFSLSDALCRVLSDESLYGRLSRGGRLAWEKRYNGSSMIEEYARLYRALGNASSIRA